jgi:thiol:disulfide interchange protein DsbD
MLRRHRRDMTSTLWLGLWLLYPAGPATADAALKTGHTEVRLLSEQQLIRPGESIWLALQLTPAAGWHTYWMNPGDAGKATIIEWVLPAGLRAGKLLWPSPERIRTGHLVSFGYNGTVNLLTEIDTAALPPGGAAIEITAAVDWLVCREICIPESGVVTLNLPLGPDSSRNPETTPVFNATRALLPSPVPWTASYIYKDNELIFDLPLQAPAERGALLFFPVEDNLIEHASDQSFLLGKNRVRVSARAGYRRQTGPFHGVLVLKRLDEAAAETFEFTAHPARQLPDIDFQGKASRPP